MTIARPLDRAPRRRRVATPRARRAARSRARAGDVNKRQEDLGGLGGDIGARDPTAGELGSNFGTSTLGHADTDHILQVPTAMAEMIMLKNKKCAAGGAGGKVGLSGSGGAAEAGVGLEDSPGAREL